MRAAALPAGAEHRSRPWLSPLDDFLPIDQVAAPPGPQFVAVGLIDLPDEQRQEPLVVDLDRGGSLLIAGPAGSGRSCALQTLAVTAARQRSCAELQLYLIDCASHGLDPLAALPHCGAALGDDPAPIGRLLQRLTEEVSRRRAEPNRRDLDAGPALLLLIDGWENLVTALDAYDSGESIEIVQTLLRDGPSARLTIAVSGGRSSLRHRALAGIGATYLLGAVSPDVAALVGLPAPPRPRGAAGTRAVAAPPPGRAIRVPDGSEVQFAFLGADAAATTGQQIIHQIAAGIDAADRERAGERPIRIRALPRRLERDRLDAGRRLRPGEIMIGVGGDAAEPIAIDLFAGDGRWLVAGPPGSGRSTLLAGALRQLHAAGIEVIVAARARSPLGEVAAGLGIAVLAPDAPAPDRPASDGRLAVLIDDIELFADAPIAGGLRVVARLHEPERRDGRTAVLVSGRSDDLANAYQGIAATIKRSRTGFLLRAAPADGALLTVQLPRTHTVSPVGRGVLVCEQPQIAQLARGRAALPVQIAL